jgi:filamentous hemagglutinin
VGLTSKLGGVLNELSDDIKKQRPTGNADIDQALGQIVATGVGTAVGAAVGGSSGAFTGFNTDRFNRQLHQGQYEDAKKYVKAVAKELGISEKEAEGRIVAEMLRNSDKQTADAAGGKHDYDVRKIVGCQNLNCDGYKNDPQYANHDYNSQFIKPNQGSYDLGQQHLGTGKTYNELVKSNIKKDPVGSTLAGAGMIGLGIAVAGGIPTITGMATGGGIGVAVNTGAQHVFNDGEISLIDAAIAGVTGALTFGTGLLPGLLINTGGALTSSAIQGGNPNMGMAGAAAGSLVGYGAGGKIEGILNNKFNPWYRPEWVDWGLGVSKYVQPSVLPSVSGTVAGAFGSEGASGSVNAILDHTVPQPNKK